MLIFNKGLKKYFCIFAKYPHFEGRVNYIKKLRKLERLILYSETPILLYITAKPIRNYTKILDILIKKQTEKLIPEFDKELEIENKNNLHKNIENTKLPINCENSLNKNFEDFSLYKNSEKIKESSINKNFQNLEENKLKKTFEENQNSLNKKIDNSLSENFKKINDSENKKDYLLNYYEPDDMEKTQQVFGMRKLPCLFLFNNANIIDCKLISFRRRSRRRFSFKVFRNIFFFEKRK